MNGVEQARKRGQEDFKRGLPCCPPTPVQEWLAYLMEWGAASQNQAAVLQRADVLGVPHDTALRLYGLAKTA